MSVFLVVNFIKLCKTLGRSSKPFGFVFDKSSFEFNMNKIKKMTLCASSYHYMSFGNPLIFTRLSDYYTLILIILKWRLIFQKLIY